MEPLQDFPSNFNDSINQLEDNCRIIEVYCSFVLLSLKKYLMCMGILSAYMFTTCMPGAYRGQKTVQDPLELTDGCESSGRATVALSCCFNSPAPGLSFENVLFFSPVYLLTGLLDFLLFRLFFSSLYNLLLIPCQLFLFHSVGSLHSITCFLC